MISKDRQEIYKAIWSLANKLRGSVDGWEFKNYVLGFMFYRYISENFAEHMNSKMRKLGHKNFKYENEIQNEKLFKQQRDELVEEKGYFILPSQLFINVLKRFEEEGNTEDANVDMHNIFKKIENSSYKEILIGLFTQMDFSDSKLGETGKTRGTKILELLRTIQEMNLSYKDVSNKKIDMFGDAYEYLISMYASNAGKSGGEYYTPPEVSEVLVKLVSSNKDHIERIYDPACGSGSLLLKFLKEEKAKDASFFGQEINSTTHHLCKMNMFLHNVQHKKFKIALGDTLVNNKFKDQKFDAIVSNPPYSVKWIGEDSEELVRDPRFAVAKALAPKSKGDLAFVMHSLYHLDEKKNGVAAIVCFPGIFYRSGKEQKIRKYLVDQNFVDSIIQLPENLFYGTSIETCLLVLKKNKKTKDVLFIDASSQFEKIKNRNRLNDQNIEWIIDVYKKRENMEGFSRTVDNSEIKEKEYNLSLNAYVRKKMEKEEIDIHALEEEVRISSEKINRLRKEIDELIKLLNQ